eukprot:scpid38088/ scgid23141/ 
MSAKARVAAMLLPTFNILVIVAGSIHLGQTAVITTRPLSTTPTSTPSPNDKPATLRNVSTTSGSPEPIARTANLSESNQTRLQSEGMSRSKSAVEIISATSSSAEPAGLGAREENLHFQIVAHDHGSPDSGNKPAVYPGENVEKTDASVGPAQSANESRAVPLAKVANHPTVNQSTSYENQSSVSTAEKESTLLTRVENRETDVMPVSPPSSTKTKTDGNSTANINSIRNHTSSSTGSKEKNRRNLWWLAGGGAACCVVALAVLVRVRTRRRSKHKFQRCGSKMSRADTPFALINIIDRPQEQCPPSRSGSPTCGRADDTPGSPAAVGTPGRVRRRGSAEQRRGSKLERSLSSISSVALSPDMMSSCLPRVSPYHGGGLSKTLSLDECNMKRFRSNLYASNTWSNRSHKHANPHQRLHGMKNLGRLLNQSASMDTIDSECSDSQYSIPCSDLIKKSASAHRSQTNHDAASGFDACSTPPTSANGKGSALARENTLKWNSFSSSADADIVTENSQLGSWRTQFSRDSTMELDASCTEHDSQLERTVDTRLRPVLSESEGSCEATEIYSVPLDGKQFSMGMRSMMAGYDWAQESECVGQSVSSTHTDWPLSESYCYVGIPDELELSASNSVEDDVSVELDKLCADVGWDVLAPGQDNNVLGSNSQTAREVLAPGQDKGVLCSNSQTARSASNSPIHNSPLPDHVAIQNKAQCRSLLRQNKADRMTIHSAIQSWKRSLRLAKTSQLDKGVTGSAPAVLDSSLEAASETMATAPTSKETCNQSGKTQSTTDGAVKQPSIICEDLEPDHLASRQLAENEIDTTGQQQGHNIMSIQRQSVSNVPKASPLRPKDLKLQGNRKRVGSDHSYMLPIGDGFTSPGLSYLSVDSDIYASVPPEGTRRWKRHSSQMDSIYSILPGVFPSNENSENDHYYLTPCILSITENGKTVCPPRSPTSSRVSPLTSSSVSPPASLFVSPPASLAVSAPAQLSVSPPAADDDD